MDMASLNGGFDSLLEGAVALFIIYWLASSFASFVVEGISSLANVRGNALRLFIAEMVEGEVKRDKNLLSGWIAGRVTLREDQTFAERLFSHSLMKALEQPKIFRSAGNTVPAYVPSHIFAKTVIDSILSATSDKTKFARLLSKVDIERALETAAKGNPAIAANLNQLAAAVVQTLGALTVEEGMDGYDVVVAAIERLMNATPPPAYIPPIETALSQLAQGTPAAYPANGTPGERAQFIGQAWLGGPQGSLAQIAAPLPATVASVARALEAGNATEALQQALRPLLTAANHDMDRLSNEIARWYDDSMQRASGWYRRYTAIWLFGLGFLLALAFNIDTPRIVGSLIANPSLRQSGYAAAAQVVNADEAKRDAMAQQFAFLEAHSIGRDHKTLLPLTAQTAVSAQLFPAFVAINLSNVEENSKKIFAAQIDGFCAANEKFCSEKLEETLSDYKTDKDSSDDEFKSIVRMVAYNPALFWSGDIAYAMATSGDLRAAKEAAQKVAEANTGEISSYVRSLPGIGLSWEVWSREGWGWYQSILALVGWLITAIMVSFGAPFWFDLMQRIVNRRGAGPKPAEAPQPDAA